MKTSRLVLEIGGAAAILIGLWTRVSWSEAQTARSSIPFVASHSDTVEDMLWMADVGPNDVVYDLGSGDGRIVIAAARDFDAQRAVGIEIDSQLVQQSRAKARQAGVADRIQFIEGDLFDQDLRDASVVALFLGHEPNIRLRPKLLSTLRPGTRVVSHDFGMGEWPPDRVLSTRTDHLGMVGYAFGAFSNNASVPDYTAANARYGQEEKIMMWMVPAPVAGIWSGKIDTPQGRQDCQLVLHQRLSKVSGSLRLSGQADSEGWASVTLWGDHIRFWSSLDPSVPSQVQMRFDGRIDSNTMTGTLAIPDHGQFLERSWQVQRETKDYAGCWEWPCATGDRSVRLDIARRDGRLVATYRDRSRSIPVTDFYDFGGGFYFTLRIDRRRDRSIADVDTGWLIGEAVLDEGALKGRIEFHPYQGADPRGGNRPAFQEWTPRLVEP